MKKVSIKMKKSGQFSPLALDYSYHPEKLETLIAYNPDKTKWGDVIKNRQKFSMHRKILVQKLKEQYADLLDESLSTQIEKLNQENCFTVCTAHQPLIFTGHAYFIHKILHCIELAKKIQSQNSSYSILPIFYIGSEDQDWDEIGQVQIKNKIYSWQPMHSVISGIASLDDEFEKVKKEVLHALSDYAHINELKEIIDRCYQKGKSLGEATRHMIFELFGSQILVLDGDDRAFKEQIQAAISLDLIANDTKSCLEKSIDFLSQNYLVQAEPQDTNFFFLKDNSRQKIQRRDQDFEIDLETISRNEIQGLIKSSPQKFSPNVIFRPLLQESILPNLCFIGGAGEISYWLELQDLFEKLNIPMPVLKIRKSLGHVKQKFLEEASQENIRFKNVFLSEEKFLEKKVYKGINDKKSKELESNLNTSLLEYLKYLGEHYKLPENQSAYAQKTVKKLEEHLGKKIKKQKRIESKKRIEAYERLGSEILPGGKLQERGESFLPLIAQYGKKILEEYMLLFEDELSITYLITD